MSWIIAKYLITATLVVLISEVAKRSDKLGGLIAALPLVTLLTLFWLYFEHQSAEKIANHAYYTFWYVLPTLPMFFVFSMLLQKFGFLGHDCLECGHYSFMFCWFDPAVKTF